MFPACRRSEFYLTPSDELFYFYDCPREAFFNNFNVFTKGRERIGICLL